VKINRTETKIEMEKIRDFLLSSSGDKDNIYRFAVKQKIIAKDLFFFI
jgi:hypothetical protein